MKKILQLILALFFVIAAFHGEANAALGKCTYGLKNVAVTATLVSSNHGDGSMVYTVTGTADATYYHKDGKTTQRTITLPANQTVTVNINNESGDPRDIAKAKARGLLDTEASDKQAAECNKNGCNNQ